MSDNEYNDFEVDNNSNNIEVKELKDKKLEKK